MKIYIMGSIIVAAFLSIIQHHWLSGLILILMVVFPSLLFVLIEPKRSKSVKNNFYKDLEFIFNVSVKLLRIVFVILIIGFGLFYKNANEVNAVDIITNTLYFSVFVFWFLLTNYFATNSHNLRETIMTFIKAIKNFFDEKFLINILLIVFIIMLSPISKELQIGLVSSYLLLFLSEVNKFYENNKPDKQSYDKHYITLQWIVNFFLVFLFVDFERLISFIVYDKTLTDNYWIWFISHIILFTLSIVISYHFETIKELSKSILKCRKR